MLTSRRLRGFSLVELLVAMAALGLVMLYTLGTFTANRDTYVVIDSVSETHQNLLAAASLIERDLRNAGYMVPKAAAACGVDSTTAPDQLFVSDADAVLAADALAPSSASARLGARPTAGMTTSWGSPQQITLDDVVIDRDSTATRSPSYDTNADGNPDSDFQVGGGVIFTNLDFPDNGVYCGVVTAVDVANNRITVELRSPPNTSVVGDWIFVPAHVYAIQGQTLFRNGQALSTDVEDLQTAWFYDLDEDHEMDAPGEDFGSGGGSPDLDASAISDPDLLREVRLNLVVRTPDDDPNDPNVGMGQRRENQTVAAAADGRRRRVHTTTIRLRNHSS